jgi:hypothetical protein
MNNSSNPNNNSGPAKGGPSAKVNKSAKAKNKNKNKNNQQKGGFSKIQNPKGVGIAQTRTFMSVAPVTQHLPNGDIIVKHREFISDVGSTSLLFNSVTYALNPGLPGTFPWLSTIANSFESYQFQSLDFRYETQSGTTTAGRILLGVDYDASDEAPTTKAQVMAYESSVSSAVWSDCDHKSLKKNLSKQKSFFVRRGALSANQDIKLYDVGNLYVCSQALGIANSYGELYVDYVVKLSTPQIGKIGVGGSIYGVFSGTSNAAPFGTSTGNLPATVASTGTTTSGSTWTFTQPWEGYATVIAIGTGITGIAPTGTGTELEINELVDAGATEYWTLNQLVEDVGQTFILTINNTTLTDVKVYFAQADV